MSIGISSGSNENLTIIKTGEGKTPDQALQALLKEGKILTARILAQNGNNALLKLGDLLVPVKTEGDLLTNKENVRFKVISTSLEKTIMEIIPNDAKKNILIPEIKINFTLPEESNEILKKIAMKPGDSFTVKTIQSGDNKVTIQIANQDIELIPELESFKGENVKLKLDLSQKGAPKFFLIENGQLIAKAEEEISTYAENKQALVFKEENLQILNKMVSEENTRITINKARELPDALVKLSFNENEKTLGNMKNVIFQSNSLKEGNFKNQDILNLTKIEFNNKTQMVEGFLKDHKLLLKPVLELKENTTIVLKYTIRDNKLVFSIDNIVSKDNEKVMNQLALKLGEFILEEKEIPEIIKSIIDNKIPLTKENIRSTQHFISFFPGDIRTGMDLLLNQNLLMGLYYQLNNINDKFLIKGYQKRKVKKEGREKSYDFSILYESDKLGDILVDLEWTEFLKLDFYCEDINTVSLLESTIGELKDNLKVKNININIEHNQEKTKKEPLKAERIILNNIDISI